MSNDTFQGRMLCRAAEKLRGVPELAAALSVPEATLRRWMNGDGTPPEAVIRASVEIFLDGRRPPWRNDAMARNGRLRQVPDA